MSEKTKADEILEKLNSLEATYKTKITELETALKTLPTKQEPAKQTHKHSSNVEFECPECQKAYDAEVSAKAVKDYREKLKTITEPVICKDCGEIVEKETEECPTCHGRKARTIGT